MMYEQSTEDRLRASLCYERLPETVWNTEGSAYAIPLLLQAQVAACQGEEPDEVLLQHLQTTCEEAESRVSDPIRVLCKTGGAVWVDGRKTREDADGLLYRPYRHEWHLRTVKCEGLYDFRECGKAYETAEMVKLLRTICNRSFLGRVSR